MKQLLQSLKTGQTEVAEVPCPQPGHGEILIRTSHTLISAGTERMLVEFGKAGWISKARQQPDKFRQVLDKIRTNGMLPTMEAVFNKLDQPLPLGYCNVGVVVESGAGTIGFKAGDRVASNGKHAEMVTVPLNLCATIPAAVSDEEAAFTVVGAIALQGIRLAQPTLGETVAVTGLGLIGLIAVQLLKAHGCRVLGIDFAKDRLELARHFGVEVVDLGAGQDPVAAAESYSRGRGVDAVLVTAATKSSEPMHQAALMCRKRGRIILVGVTGLELSRDEFFRKELTFQVSASYGPGRYDPNYEEKGQDYPLAYVRWTEQRNFEAVLDMMADGRLDVRSLISHRFSIDEAEKAYDLVAGAAPSLGILLNYPCLPTFPASKVISLNTRQAPHSDAHAGRVAVSFVGSGNYATSVLIPAFKKAGAILRSVASRTGVTGLHAARKFGICETTTDTSRIFSDPDIDAVVITTQHDSHATLALQALQAEKHVFVEKPLCLKHEELQQIEAFYKRTSGRGPQSPLIMVGFNRRFAPQVRKMKQLLCATTGPKAFIMTVNAGAIPSAHWTQDPEVGGGRIAGEACHFIDLLRFLAGVPITGWRRLNMDSATQDTATLQLGFADGSIGSIHYFANGSTTFPKERLEVFTCGRILQLDNFRKLTGFGWPGFGRMNLWRQDKGHRACVKAFVEAVKGRGPAPIALDELIEVSRASIELACNRDASFCMQPSALHLR